MKVKIAPVQDLDLQPGDILLLQIKGVVGWLVWLMQAINGDLSRWTHVGIVLDNEELFEAQPGGAVITPLAKYATRPAAVVRYYQRPVMIGAVDGGAARQIGHEMRALADVLNANFRYAIVQRARSMKDLGYNWTTYFYLAAFRLGIRPNWLKVRVQNDERVICSQAADLIYDDCGIHLFADKRMPYDVTPGDLADLAG